MADIMLPVDTAVVVPVNLAPLVAETDGFTIQAVAYNAAGMALKWNFVTAAGAMSQVAVSPTASGDYAWVDLGGGMMSIAIPATGGASINNDTEGFGWFTGKCTASRPWWGPIIQFSPAIVVNALVAGTDKLEVDLVSILGTALTETAGLIAAAFKKFFNVATPTGTVNSLSDQETGAVVADGANSIIAFKTDLASTEDNYCVPNFIKFTSGACINQTRKIASYGGTSKLLLVTSGFTDIPAVGDTFKIINE